MKFVLYQVFIFFLRNFLDFLIHRKNYVVWYFYNVISSASIHEIQNFSLHTHMNILQIRLNFKIRFAEEFNIEILDS